METVQVQAPQSIGDTGIPRPLLQELALKILFLGGEMSLAELADRMCLSLGVTEEIFQFFRKEQLCHVKAMSRGTHIIAATDMGKDRAAKLLEFSRYTGPAPVSLEEYGERVRLQTVEHTRVEPGDLNRAFEKMVLSDNLLTRIGTAVVSGTSIFLYGPPGTGKTTLSSNIPAIYGDFVVVPHAIAVDNQIITIYDPSVHLEVNEPTPDDWDRRWVLCQRPRVTAGGELSSEMLDLKLNTSNLFLTAPLQLKANNGVLVLDDFGRQRMRPDELLNRWMTPLDRRTDFLTLPGGQRFEVPFDVLVVFSTNLDPRTLADEAFLRRIPNKIALTYATPEQFAEIFQRECAARMLLCEVGLAEYVVDLITNGLKQTLMHSHARDIVNQIFWSAKYAGVEPRATRSAVQQACASYFLPTAKV
jgi:hypothetical protein